MDGADQENDSAAAESNKSSTSKPRRLESLQRDARSPVLGSSGWTTAYVHDAKAWHTPADQGEDGSKDPRKHLISTHLSGGNRSSSSGDLAAAAGTAGSDRTTLRSDDCKQQL